MGAVVVMGVSGAGKSTVGRALAEATGADFVEGDDLHPPENVMLMASGQPLSDAQREPWLDAIATTIERHHRDGRDVVVSCSALKRAYRDRLRQGGPARFVFLDADHDELRRRVDARTHEFMPPTLLDDQIATLEHPTDEHDVVVVEPAGDVPATVDRVLNALGPLA
jgi:gluconokinase